MAKKSSPGPTLKAIIRKYASTLGDLKAERHDPKFEFNFEFTSPKGSLPNGKPTGIGFNVFKPKKGDFIEIGSKVIISPEHIKLLDADPKKGIELFNTITKMFLLKNVTYIIRHKEHFFVLYRRIYLDNKNYVLKQKFYEILRNLLNANLYAIRLIQQSCSGKVDKNDLDKGIGPEMFM